MYSTQSCVQYVHSRYPAAPLVDATWYQKFPRTMPSVGAVAIFHYSSGLDHVGVVESLGEKGFIVSDCNYSWHVCTKRFVPWNHYSIVGFWDPPEYTPSRGYAEATDSNPDTSS